MSFRFYRYDGGKPKYQFIDLEVKTDTDGTAYRIPVFADAKTKEEATIFPIDYRLAEIFADWFQFYVEEVEK